MVAVTYLMYFAFWYLPKVIAFLQFWDPVHQANLANEIAPAKSGRGNPFLGQKETDATKI